MHGNEPQCAVSTRASLPTVLPPSTQIVFERDIRTLETNLEYALENKQLDLADHLITQRYELLQLQEQITEHVSHTRSNGTFHDDPLPSPSSEHRHPSDASYGSTDATRSTTF